jgi:molybdopterin/thiamine biosynthesis adenylyltransferase
MDLYNRQKELKLNRKQSVTIVGCGGIGYWVAKICALSGIKKILLFDPDVIEDVNLNRMDVPFKFLGRNKADVAKIAIDSIRDNVVCYSFPFKFNDMADKTDWVIDCTDRDTEQLENQKIARKMGSNYFKAGYDGENFGIHNSVAEWGESTEGYRIVPSWSVPAMIVAALSVAKIMKYPDKEVISSVSKLFRIDR